MIKSFKDYQKESDEKDKKLDPFNGPVANSIRKNPVHGNYEFEETTVNSPTYKDSHPNWNVYYKGKKVGDIWVHETPTHVGLLPHVEKEHRQKGHNTAFHDIISYHAKKHNKQLKRPPEGDLTDKGKIFWNRYKNKNVG